jgi:hypothetical protein
MCDFLQAQIETLVEQGVVPDTKEKEMANGKTKNTRRNQDDS